MRTRKSLRVGLAVAAAVVALSVAGVARAQITTERPGSILIFPKVVNTGTRDTVIQISNTRNFTVNAHCFYIDGSVNPSTGQPRWQETDFFLFLTRSQPTHWRVGAGRTYDPTDNFSASWNFPDGAGLDPGVVPPVRAGFTGELLCAEIDPSGAPIINNALKGNATLIGSDGDAAKYNGIAVYGPDMGVSPNGELPLDDSEYSACPSSLRVDLLVDGSPDPAVQAWGNGGTCDGASSNPGAACQIGGSECTGGTCTTAGATSSVRNFLTVVPCSQDFENLIPGQAHLAFFFYDEFENQISALGNNTDRVNCWRNYDFNAPPLNLANNAASSGSQFVSAVIEAQDAGVVGVAESVVTDSTGVNRGTSTLNVMVKGSLAGSIIQLPTVQ
jgi:hypothetical protein